MKLLNRLNAYEFSFRKVLLALGLLAAAVGMASAAPSVSVSDQAVVAGTVTIDTVVSDGPGWLVIHKDGGSGPGPVIGYAPVTDGENDALVVTIDASEATPKLYAMLHVDAGVVGSYEFPGPDVPVKVDGMMVSPPFAVTY